MLPSLWLLAGLLVGPPTHPIDPWLATARPVALAPEARCDDLGPLLEDLTSVAVVGLGESSHGTAEQFRLKQRLLVCLVRRGRPVRLALEASWEAGRAMNAYVQGEPVDLVAELRRMPAWPWDVQEMVDLLGALRAARALGGEIDIHGVDRQLAVAEARALRRWSPPPEVEAALAHLDDRHGFLRFSALADAQNHLDALTAFSRTAPPGARELAVQVAEAARLAASTRPEWFQTRDDVMAANTLRLIEPDGIVALWAHNVHLARVLHLPGRHAAGGRLHEALGPKLRLVALGQGRGAFRAMDRRAGLAPAALPIAPPPPTTLDAALLRAAPTAWLGDLRAAAGDAAAWLDAPQMTRWLPEQFAPGDEADNAPAIRMRAGFDWLLFVADGTAARGLPRVPFGTAPEPVRLVPGPLSITSGGALAPGWRGPRGAPLDPYALTAEGVSGACVEALGTAGASDWVRLSLMLHAEPWRGRRVRLSARVRAHGPEVGDEAHLVVRVMGEAGEAAEVASAGPIRGPVAGQHTVAVAVPPSAALIEVWLVATGRSRACFGDARLDLVD